MDHIHPMGGGHGADGARQPFGPQLPSVLSQAGPAGHTGFPPPPGPQPPLPPPPLLPPPPKMPPGAMRAYAASPHLRLIKVCGLLLCAVMATTGFVVTFGVDANPQVKLPGLPGVPSLPTGFPTDFPTGLPSDFPSLPTGQPGDSGPSDLPTGLPSGLPGLPDFPSLPAAPEAP